MQILAILFFILFSTPVLSPQTRGIAGYEIEQIKKAEDISKLRKSEFTPDRLLEYLKLRNVRNRLIVYRQAVLETGWFKSGSFTEFSNLFGMKVPRIRVSLVRGSGYGHSAYDHWTDSVEDFIMWQEYWEGVGFDLVNYYVFLKELPYATDRYYVNKLKRLDV